MIFMILSLIVTLILLFFINPIVSIMSTPVEAIQETTLYLKICFIGIPFITAYNIISSIFRGLGDSKRPMYFVAVACFFHIVLDFIFIGYFNMHAVGAAFGTEFEVLCSCISTIAASFYCVSTSIFKAVTILRVYTLQMLWQYLHVLASLPSHQYQKNINISWRHTTYTRSLTYCSRLNL